MDYFLLSGFNSRLDIVSYGKVAVLRKAFGRVREKIYGSPRTVAGFRGGQAQRRSKAG
jgi:hypothetical protein